MLSIWKRYGRSTNIQARRMTGYDSETTCRFSANDGFFLFQQNRLPKHADSKKCLKPIQRQR